MLIVASSIVVNGQQTWMVDKSHTNVSFTVTHMLISEVEGNFKLFEGSIITSKPDFSDAKITFTVDVASISTDNDARDNHLKNNDFFNAPKYPEMKFVSSSMVKKADGKYELKGKLTIRDVTKDVTFEVSLGGVKKDPYGNTKAGFKARSSINRQDYGLTWSGKTEAGELVVSDEVEIYLRLQFSLQK